MCMDYIVQLDPWQGRHNPLVGLGLTGAGPRRAAGTPTSGEDQAEEPSLSQTPQITCYHCCTIYVRSIHVLSASASDEAMALSSSIGSALLDAFRQYAKPALVSMRDPMRGPDLCSEQTMHKVAGSLPSRPLRNTTQDKGDVNDDQAFAKILEGLRVGRGGRWS